MAEEQEENKSEQATPHKLGKAREKGSVARGADLGFLAVLATAMGFAWIQGAALRSRLAEAARQALSAAPDIVAGSDALFAVTGIVFSLVAYTLVWLPILVFAVVLVLELVQTGPVFATEPLRPDFSRLNPANGLKRLFSARLLIETAKSIFKMMVYGAIAVLVIRDAGVRAQVSVTDGRDLARAMSAVTLRLIACFALAAMAFAAIDQLIARRDFRRRMRMTRRDVRREARDREGEPRIKQQRKQLHRQFIKLSKSVRNIRDADVLIVNPTHYAVALKYEPASMAAPTIVAQAMNQFALRLRRLALIYGVTVVQDERLARDLYNRGRFEREVPEVYFRPVAEIYIAIRRAAVSTQTL